MDSIHDYRIHDLTWQYLNTSLSIATSCTTPESRSYKFFQANIIHWSGCGLEITWLLIWGAWFNIAHHPLNSNVWTRGTITLNLWARNSWIMIKGHWFESWMRFPPDVVPVKSRSKSGWYSLHSLLLALNLEMSLALQKTK